MVRQSHHTSEQFIMSLSDFYRQTLKYNENTTLPLAEELAVLESYLFVMKSRSEAAMAIHIQTDARWENHHLPTMALQGVVENCFKHNSMTSKQPLHIHIQTNELGFIEVCNNKQPKLGEQATSGVGLNLLHKRYALLDAPNGVKVMDTPDQFCVHLQLLRR